MPEARFDPLGRRWVLLAPERAQRGVPDLPADPPDPAPCDFCPGREDRTPPETYAVREDGTWRVRAFPNLYPATAFHEVVVHTPDHQDRFEDLSPSHRVDVLRVYRARMRAADVAAAIVAINRGRRAGASRFHAHGQIFGLDLVPPTLEREVAAFADEPCVLCDIAEDRDLHVTRCGSVTVLAHPVPLLAHELLIVPPCLPRFEEEADELLGDTAEAFAAALGAVKAAFGPEIALNLVVHTAPAEAGRFHWHAHVYPRIATWGALEVGAELPIVAAHPERTADRLRRVCADDPSSPP